MLWIHRRRTQPAASSVSLPTRRLQVGRRLYLPQLCRALLVVTLLTLPNYQALSAASSLRPVAQSTQGKLAVVGAEGAELYDAPNGTSQETLAAGATLTAVGRTADSLWIVVATDDNRSGWVEAKSIVLFGAEQLPVMMEGDEPTSAATPAATTAATSATPAAASPTTAATKPPATPTAVPPTATPTTVPPTATPTATPMPTATPSPTPMPPTPTLAARSSTALIAVVGSEGALLTEQPAGDEGDTLSVGTALSALGRNATSDALYVATTDNRRGWVARSAVVVFNVGTLPVVGGEADAAPSAEEADAVATEPPAEEATSAAEEEDAAPTKEATAPSAATATTAPTEVPLPTATATQAMRPTPDAGDKPTAQVAMSGSRLNIRSGPGTQFPIIGKALPRETFIALGRNGGNSWVQLEVPDLPGGFGWVSSQLVVVSVPIAQLPISIETNDEAAPQSSTIAQQVAAAPVAQPVAATGSESAAQNNAPAQPASTGPTGLSGRMVIQSQGGGAFYLYELGSGALRQVGSGLDPALSPDGSTIAFTRIGQGGGVYLINSDGSNERQIYKAGEQLMSPKWSPDGKWIVFSRSNGSYTCNDLPFVGCISDGQIFPAPSDQLPEPVKEAVEEARDEVLDGFERVSRPNWQLARVNLDGKEYRDLAALDSARAPDWTNAGIAYQSAGGIQITEDTPDGETRKVYFDGYDWDPDWQPNGGRIVFQSKEGPHWEIFGVNPDGTGLAALTRPVTTLVDVMPSNVSPTWSPDGSMIAFLSNRTDSNEAGAWRVWVMNADGSNQRPLPINLDITYGYAGEQMISWGN